MELNKDIWTDSDIKEYQQYLLSLSKGKEKGEWEKRIINTQMPCIAVPSPEVKRITNEIFKGNYESFLKFFPWENFTNTSIIGGIICKIKDFDKFKSYLNKYANMCDNWATCDCLKFLIKDNNKQQFFNLSKEYISSSKPFIRRLGVTILFKFVDDADYIEQIFEILNKFENEQEYYVNMVVAWLVCECFIKQRDKTLIYLENNKLNKFTLNKAISKCHDSFRISSEDKDFLKTLRR